uniref:Heat shock cognate 71 kDa protein n=1 Tax=Heterorhabditis bacteriophora TaxID=37862 RepID=A0A1I7WP90_HETBA
MKTNINGIIDDISWNDSSHAAGALVGEPLIIDCGVHRGGEKDPHIEITDGNGEPLQEDRFTIAGNEITIEKLDKEFDGQNKVLLDEARKSITIHDGGLCTFDVELYGRYHVDIWTPATFIISTVGNEDELPVEKIEIIYMRKIIVDREQGVSFKNFINFAKTICMKFRDFFKRHNIFLNSVRLARLVKVCIILLIVLERYEVVDNVNKNQLALSILQPLWDLEDQDLISYQRLCSPGGPGFSITIPSRPRSPGGPISPTEPCIMPYKILYEKYIVQVVQVAQVFHEHLHQHQSQVGQEVRAFP